MITDELLRLVTTIIPISEWKQIAYEALDLTVNEVDAIESAQTRADVIFHLLHQAVQRNQISAKDLKQKIKDAREDGIKVGQKGLENTEAEDGKQAKTVCSICEINFNILIINMLLFQNNLECNENAFIITTYFLVYFSNSEQYPVNEFVQAVRTIRQFLDWLHGLHYGRSNLKYAHEPRSQNLCAKNVEFVEM